MVAKPVLGYPSKTAAITALLEAGELSHTEIAEQCETTEHSVYVQASIMRRRQRGLPAGKAAKAMRIYRAALEVIGEALEIEPHTLHHAYSRLHFADLSDHNLEMMERVDAEAIKRAQIITGNIPDSPPLQISDLPEEPESEADDHSPDVGNMVPVTPPGDLFTLRHPVTQDFLTKSGKGTTRHRDIAYRGTHEQAQAARQASAFAEGMTIIPFNGGKP